MFLRSLYGTINGSVASLETITAGRWYTIVAWHDAVNNTLNIQVNNGTVSSVSYASGAMDTTYPLSIGAHSDGSFGLNGRIDEVALYKRVLTAAERSWLYNGGVGRTYADLSATAPGASSIYTYGNSAHKHAVTALSTGESYTYDANGNTLAPGASAGVITCVEGGITYTQTFDIENRLSSVTVGTQITQFIYDGDGNLVKKIKPDGSKTIYVGGIYEVDKTSGGTVTQTRTYYPAGGAMRVDGTRYYVLKDHLGSASVVTNQSASVVGQDRFMPFGETRFTTGAMKTDKLFTGQREITGLGIYNYGARFYSPKLGRFLSADTITPSYTNPQDLNRFSYVMNNPIKLIDPTGHKCAGEAKECLNDNGRPINGAGGLNPQPKKEKDETSDVNSQEQLQFCLDHLLAPQCQPYDGVSISEWPPHGYYVAGYRPKIYWRELDWPGLLISGAGVIGDLATIATFVAGVVPPLEPIVAVTGPIALGGEAVNKVAVGYDLYKTFKENDPSGSTVDLLSFILKDSRIIPVVSLYSNLKGVYDATAPHIIQQPILQPIVSPIITNSP